MTTVSHEPPAEVKRETLADKNRRMDAEWELLRELDRAERRIIELQAEVETLKARNAALHIRLHRAYAAQRDTEPMP